MTKANIGFDAKSVTITPSGLNSVYVDCDAADVDDILTDISYEDIADYVSSNLDEVLNHIDSDSIIEYLTRNGLIESYND